MNASGPLTRLGLVVSLLLLPARLAAGMSLVPPVQPLEPAELAYRIDARLDPTQHRVYATQTLRVVNVSEVPVKRLHLAMFQNAFASPRTVFMRGNQATRRSGRTLVTRGGTELTALSSSRFPGVELREYLAPHSPSEPDDRTDLALALPAPLAPGETITLEFAFVTELPLMVERSGYSGSFHAVTQWFPKLARLLPDGSSRHFAYHSLAEFASGFADYDVTLRVPHDFVIAAPASGEPVTGPSELRSERFVVERVTDFAWFAWDRFDVYRTRHGSIELSIFTPPNHTVTARHIQDTLAFGLDFYGAWFGAYPHPTLSVVHPPAEASPAGAMEYPRLFSTGGPWYLPHLPLTALSGLVLHELAHQWFPGLVATDEAAHPVLDEGLASFAESRALTARFGQASFARLGFLSFSDLSIRRAVGLAGPSEQPLARPAADFGTTEALTREIYNRFVLLLEALGESYGRSELSQALRCFSERGRYSHPGPELLVDCTSSHLGDRAADTLRTALDQGGFVDYALRALEVNTSAKQMVTAVVERRGTLSFPVQLVAHYRDGRREIRQWDGIDPERRFDFVRRGLTTIEVDPERRLLIDRDWKNQILRLETELPEPSSMTWLVQGFMTVLLSGLGT